MRQLPTRKHALDLAVVIGGGLLFLAGHVWYRATGDASRASTTAFLAGVALLLGAFFVAHLDPPSRPSRAATPILAALGLFSLLGVQWNAGAIAAATMIGLLALGFRWLVNQGADRTIDE